MFCRKIGLHIRTLVLVASLKHIRPVKSSIKKAALQKCTVSVLLLGRAAFEAVLMITQRLCITSELLPDYAMSSWHNKEGSRSAAFML